MNVRQTATALALLAGCVGAKAANTIQVTLDIRPTLLTSKSAPNVSASMAPEGQLAESFSLNYVIDAEPSGTNNLTSNSVMANYGLATDSTTPFMSMEVPRNKPNGPWQLSSGASLKAEWVPMSSSIITSIRLGTQDGFDSLGVGNYTPSWIWYGREIKLSDVRPIEGTPSLSNLALARMH